MPQVMLPSRPASWLDTPTDCECIILMSKHDHIFNTSGPSELRGRSCATVSSQEPGNDSCAARMDDMHEL